MLLAVGTLGAGMATAQAQDAAGVRDVDWRNASVDVPKIGACPWQHVDFHDGAAETADHVYRFAPGRDIVYADVTGEGVEDALMVVSCGPRDSEFSTGLIAMTADPDARPLGTVFDPPNWLQVPSDFMVWYRDIAVAVQDGDSGQTHTEYYRWASSAKAFVRIDGQ